METTTTTSQPQTWALVAHLASCGHTEAIKRDAAAFVGELAAVLQQHLPQTQGLLVSLDEQHVLGAAGWGVSDNAQRQYIAAVLDNSSSTTKMAMLPLRVDDQTLGYLLLKASGVAKDATSELFFAALTAQLAMLLHLQQRNEEWQIGDTIRLLVNSSSELVGVLDTPSLLHSVLERASELIGYASSAVYLVEAHGALSLVTKTSPRADNDYPLVVAVDEQSPLVQAATTRTLQVGRLPSLPQANDNVTIAVPLVAREAVVGVLLCTLARTEDAVTGRDRSLAQLFGNHTTLLVSNAQLFNQQQQRARELFVLYENSKEINSTSQIEALLDRATENITLALQADCCITYLLDEINPNTLRLASVYETTQGHTTLDQENNVSAGVDAFFKQMSKTAPTIINDLSRAVVPRQISMPLQMLGCQRAMLVLLHGDDQTVGVLAVGYAQANQAILQTGRNLAQVFANQVATAVIHRQLYVAEQKRTSELEQLQRISQHLNTGLAFEETLEAIVNGIDTLLDFAGARVYIYDNYERTLRLAWQRGFAVADDPSGTDDMVANWIVRHRRALRIDDLSQSSTLGGKGASGGLLLANGTIPQSYLGVPLQVGDDFIGTLEVATVRRGSFSSDDERLLLIVAGQAAQVIVNAHRYEQADDSLRARVEQLRALQRVSSQLAITLNQDEIFEFVLEQAIRATSATHGMIALRSAAPAGDSEESAETVLDVYFSSEGQEVISAMRGHQADDMPYLSPGTTNGLDVHDYVVIEAKGYSDSEHKYLLHQPLAAPLATAYTALRQREPEITDVMSERERTAARFPEAASALAAPIFYQARVVGVVVLFSPQVRSFDYDAVEFLTALTHQAAIGIGNEQRYTELEQVSTQLQRRASVLSEVLEIGQAVRADSSLETLLEQIGYSIIESANFRTILFCLIERDNPDLLRPIVGAGIPLNEMERIRHFPLPEILVTQYLEPRYLVGRSYFVPAHEAVAIERSIDIPMFAYLTSDAERSPEEWQPNDRLVVPLYSTEGRLLGVMFSSDPINRQRPDRRTVELLEIFADRAATAIENNYLLGDARAHAEQMTALFKVGSVITSTIDRDALLRHIYEEIVAFMGQPSLFFVATYRPEGDRLYFESFMREGEVFAQSNNAVVPNGGLTKIIIEQGKPILIRDWTIADPTVTSRAFKIDKPPSPEIHSWLGVPLLSQSNVTGVLVVQHYAPNMYAERDEQFLSTLANQLAVALERVSLFHERERQIAELDVINQIGRITNSTLDLEQMLREVYTRLAGFLILDSFYVFVYYADIDQIVLSLEVDNDYIELNTQNRMPGDTTLTGRIISTRQPLRFDDLGATDLTDQGLKPLMFGSKRKSASWIGVPLLVGGDSVVGVISVQSYTPALYGDREQSFLTTVASQLALGVQNARLFEQAQRQVEQLRSINEVSLVATSTMEHKRIYKAVVDAMARATNVDQARLVVFDRDHGVAPVLAEYVETPLADTLTVPLDKNPAVQWIDEHQQPLVAEVAQQEPLLRLSHETFRKLDIRSIAMIPLVINGVVFGCVGLDFVGHEGTFAPEQLQLCQTIANQAATAIVNARLFSETQTNAQALQSKVGELSTLLDAARILSSLLQPAEVLNKLMDLVSRQLHVTTVALWTLDNGILTPAAIDGIDEEIATTMRVPVGQGLTGRVAATGMPLVIADVGASGGSLYPQFQSQNHLISFMGVPVVYREDIVGVLSVMTAHRREFSNDEMLLLVGLADQAATALENARLFQERERRIRELATINRISAAINATLDQQVLLEHLHQGIGEFLDVSTSLVGLYDEQTDMLSYPLVFDQGRPVAQPTQPLPHGPNGWVIRNRQSLHLNTAEEAKQRGLEESDSGVANSVEQSYLVTPIIFGEHVIGVISIQSYEPHAFDDNDLRFLTTVANQAAVAINNAVLFGEARLHANEMTTLFEVSQNLSGTLDRDDILFLVGDAALRLIGAEFCAVLRVDADHKVEKQIFVDRDGDHGDLAFSVRQNGMTTRLLEGAAPMVVNNLAQAENPNIEVLKRGVRSMIGIVINSFDEQLGVLWTGMSTPHDWSPHQISLLSILANQGGQALKSAQLFELEQSGRRMADTLRDVAQTFTSTLALNEIQTLILDQLLRVVAYNSAAVLLRDEGYGLLQVTEARGVGLAELTGKSFDIEDSSFFTIMEMERKPVLIKNTQTDDRFSQMARLGWQAQSWIGAPLLVDNEVIGVLTIGSNVPDAYDVEAMDVTFALANQASQAIQNARLFNQVSNLAMDLEQRVVERTAELEQATVQVSREKERLEAVHAVTIELTAMLNLESIIVRALELVSINIGVARGSIILLEGDHKELVCRAVLYAQGDVRPANIPLRFDGNAGLAGWVMDHHQMVCVPDVQHDPRWVHAPGRADNVRSVAAVPLKTTDTNLGVLILSSQEVNYFTDSQMNQLGTIANIVAAAVYNAQLYNYTTELADRLSGLLEEQREATSKSQAVFSSVTEGVIVLDNAKQITLFNPAAEQILQIPASAMQGQPFDILLEYGDRDVEYKRAELIHAGLIQGMERLSDSSEGIYSTSLDLPDPPNPTQIIAVNLSRVVSPDGHRYGDVAVLRDITREIESERAKQQFISDVSHELRTPLTAIKGYVDVFMLTASASLSDDQRQYMDIIRNNTKRLHLLIEDILVISRPEEKNRLYISDVDIAAVIEEVAQALRFEIERKDMAVTMSIARGLPMIEADQKRITQIVSNLFSNAIKYTYESGQIIIRAFVNQGNLLQVEVEDTGVGMSDEQQQKLFRPFYRADNPLRDTAGGTGLGLSIAKSFAEQHGGKLWVESVAGEGSTFKFVLPLHQPETVEYTDEEGDE